MITSIRHMLRDRINDYSVIEKVYREVTGYELVTDPLTSLRSTAGELSLSATVIIPTWNAKSTILSCLTAIEQSSFNRKYPHLLEVIVVDDGSMDGTYTILKNADLNLSLTIAQQSHHSRAHAFNTGLSIASGDIIISCDADVILCPFTIEELMKRHQVLDNVLLVGFRSDILPDDPRISVQQIRLNLEQLFPIFWGDNRIVYEYAGWPENMCIETSYLKQLDGIQNIWVSDGFTPDGDLWNLPRMVYGALFSLPRSQFVMMDGFDERFYGWGWEDTLIGALSFAMGNFIVPVLSAVGLHISHPDRSPDKWKESKINYDLLKKIINAPMQKRQSSNIDQAKNRISHTINRNKAISGCDIPQSWNYQFNKLTQDAEFMGIYHYHLGKYKTAVRYFSETPINDANSLRINVKKAQAMRMQRRYREAQIVLESLLPIFPKEGLVLAELGLIMAANEDYIGARICIEQSKKADPNNALASYILCGADNHIRRGLKYASQGNHKIAVRDFEAALINNYQDVRAHEAILRSRKCLSD